MVSYTHTIVQKGLITGSGTTPEPGGSLVREFLSTIARDVRHRGEAALQTRS